MDVTLRCQFSRSQFLSGPRGTEIGRVNERPVSMARRGLANVASVSDCDLDLQVAAQSRYRKASRNSLNASECSLRLG